MVKKKNGFTLIELLIVCAVIAVLTTLAAINIQGQLLKVRDAKRKSDLHEIKNSLSLYNNANGLYPTSDDNSHVIRVCPGQPGQDCLWGAPWNSSGIIYMNVLPADPKNSFPLVYGYRQIGNDNFLLWSVLEYKTDPAATTSQSVCVNVLAVAQSLGMPNNYTGLTGLDITQEPVYVVCN